MSTLTESAPHGQIADRDRMLVRFGVLLTLVLLAARLLVIGRFGLFADEAYYWLWSEDLSFGYYDHPPMVALLVRAGTTLFGDTEFGIRVVGAVSVVVDVALVYGVARVLWDSRRIAAWAAIFANLTFMAMLSVIIVPDQAMLTFWLAGLFGLAKIARGGAGSWWLVTGAMFGFAAASKYSTAFMALAVLMWLALVPSLRKWFRSPWPYLGALAALVVLSPVIQWNISNGWPSVVIQLNRNSFSTARFDGLPLFLAGFAVAVTPLILVLAVRGLIRCLGKGWRLDPVRALLVVTPIPLFGYFAFFSIWDVSEPHWISPIVFLAAILAAIPMGSGRRLATSIGWSAVALGSVLTMGTYAALADLWLPFKRVVGYTVRFHGWTEFADNVAAKVRSEGAAYVVAADYGLASLMRFYLRHTDIQVYQLGEWGRGVFGEADVGLADLPGLFVDYGSNVAASAGIAAPYFADVTFTGLVSRGVPGGGVEECAAFVVRGPTPLAMPLFGGVAP